MELEEELKKIGLEDLIPVLEGWYVSFIPTCLVFKTLSDKLTYKSIQITMLSISRSQNR